MQLEGGELKDASRKAVLGRSLREQVYDLIRGDLSHGRLAAGERFVEVELAARYGVSRTPVREALFQLVNDGLIVSEERGYLVPPDDSRSFADRLEVHLLLDPKVAFYAAQSGDKDGVKRMTHAFEGLRKAHKAGKFEAFVDASHELRVAMRAMCRNVALRRCAMLVEDQFLAARNEMFRDPANQAIDVHYTQLLLNAIRKGAAVEAEQIVRNFMITVSDRTLGEEESERLLQRTGTQRSSNSYEDKSIPTTPRPRPSPARRARSR